MRSTGMIKAQLSATVNKKYRSLLSLCLSLCLFLALTAIVGSPLWAANEGPNIPISIENGATAPDTATLLGEDQQNPTVIALPDKNKWFVVWEDWRNWGATGADIYGRFINGDGTYCGDEIPISTAAGNQTVPTAAYRNSPSGEDKILIAWQDTRGGAASGYLYYKVLDVSALAVDCASGVVLGGENIVGYSSIDSDSLISRKLPKVAYDAARDKFWLVWVESRNALQRIEEQPFGIAATLVGPYCEDGSNPNFTCEDGNDPDYLCADGSEPRLQCADGSYPVLKCEDLSDAWMDWISGQFIFNCADESVPIPVCGDNSIATPVCLDGSDVALRCRDSSDVAWRCEDGSECKYNRVAITTQWKFGDSNYASYVTVDAASGVAGIPEIIRNSDIIPLDTDEDGIFDNFRDSICTVRLISHSRSSEKDVYVYEYFKNVNNVTIACDDSSPETLIVWEGVRGRATLTCTYEDTNKNEVPDYFEPFFAELVLDEWENDDGLVHIFSIFDKYINQTVVNSQLIDASTKSCFYPAVGFDSSHRKFLVAWEDRDARDGAGDGIHSKIFGQLVYSGGGLYGANLPISFQDTNEDGIQDKNILDANQTRPQVAIDSTNQRFLVTWQDGRNSQVSLENLDIFGQFVDSEGSLRGNNYAVCVEPANQYNPVTVFNAGNHQFLSVWKDARNLNTTNSDIYGQRFTLGQPQLILLNDDDTSLVPPLLDFDSVQAGEAPTLLVKMKNIGDSVIKIDYVTPLEAPFTYVSLPPELLSVDDGNTLNLVPGASYKLYVKFEPTADGTFIDDFTIQSDATSLTINLQGVRVPTVPPVAGVRVTPGSGDFGSVFLGESKSMIFTFANTGNVDVDIVGSDMPASGFTVSGLPGTLKAGEDVAVLVTFAPSELGSYPGMFRVFYNYGVEASEIALAGVGTDIPPSPGITVSPESGDFGSVNLGESKSMIFTFANTGNVDVDIQGTDIPASGFTVSGLPGTIKAGKSVPVLVTFTPAELRSYSGVFRAFYNYGVEPSEINLIGVGSHEPAAPGITVSPESGDFGSVNLSESKSMIF
ncbi:MAG: choice-of-anchor D domain-containing protein, partial [Deltaproteobacteria bacterium]|nr:choice-of-anchor D domain-containing protein [Deltaproteobacteria bacterium]